MYSPQERYRILQSLFLADGAPWVSRFSFLLLMSVVIATLGLANNQPAAVIAAMVIAPLMTPVLGIAAGIMLGLVRQVARLTLIVVTSSVAAVAVGWFISFTLVVHEITGEELSRTSPRIRDFAIALAAGAAGMYGIVRKDLSGVLPGVAIAVALVPPLGTIGIVLELGEWSLARGAALLYGMNIVAIILAAMVVLVVTDFIESPSIRSPKVIVSTVFLLIVSIAIIVPVWNNSRELDGEALFAEPCIGRRPRLESIPSGVRDGPARGGTRDRVSCCRRWRRATSRRPSSRPCDQRLSRSGHRDSVGPGDHTGNRRMIRARGTRGLNPPPSTERGAR